MTESVEIPAGALSALVGPSGGGKSTLLRIIAGLEAPDRGTVEILGADATRLPPQRRQVGFVFQHHAAFRHMTVAKNVAFGLEIRRRPRAEVRRRVRELLELVHIEPLADRYPSELSGGQRRRMALARALAVDPKVLLLDEPFGALDARVRSELRGWLRRLHREARVTTVFVTHDQEEAMELADQVVVINEGTVEQAGTPDEVYDRPANPFVLRFVGPVTRLAGRLVRPYDLRIGASPVAGAIPATVVRVARLGFEVRVEVRVDGEVGGEDAWIQLTRAEADELGVQAGRRVFVRAPDDAGIPAPAAAG